MDNKTRIGSPQHNSVVHRSNWGFENDPNYPCDVFIVSGDFFRNGRVSNWWTWRRILDDGSLDEPESGYGDFSLPKEYKVDFTITKTE